MDLWAEVLLDCPTNLECCPRRLVKAFGRRVVDGELGGDELHDVDIIVLDT